MTNYNTAFCSSLHLAGTDESRLISLDNLHQYSRLSYLRLTDGIIDTTNIDTHTKLDQIAFMNCAIGAFEAKVSNSTSLTNVCWRNHRTNHLEPWLAKQTQLKVLSLSYVTLSDDELNNFTSLTKLNLNGIKIQGTFTPTQTDLKSLSIISCEKGSVDVTHLTALTHLNINRSTCEILNPNQLKNLMELTTGLEGYKQLYPSFSKFTDLQTLEIHKPTTPLKKLVRLANLISLTIVGCTNVQLGVIKKLMSLQKLVLSSRAPRELNETIDLKNLTSLTFLDIKETTLKIALPKQVEVLKLPSFDEYVSEIFQLISLRQLEIVSTLSIIRSSEQELYMPEEWLLHLQIKVSGFTLITFFSDLLGVSRPRTLENFNYSNRRRDLTLESKFFKGLL